MAILGSRSSPVPAGTDTWPDCGPAGGTVPATPAASGQARPLAPGSDEPFVRVARLAAIAMSAPRASVMVGGDCFPLESASGSVMAGQQNLLERSLCRVVVGSGDKLIISDIRADPRMGVNGRRDPVSVIAWAGFPMRSPDGDVTGVLWVSDRLPRQWGASDIATLESLAQVASEEIALRSALASSTESAALARTLQESLLPARLPDIPGLQIAARYTAAGTGAEFLGDFYDVFPSLRGHWALAVGDVCGKGAGAAKSTALARYTLRAQARLADPAEPGSGQPESGPAGLARR